MWSSNSGLDLNSEGHSEHLKVSVMWSTVSEWHSLIFFRPNVPDLQKPASVQAMLVEFLGEIVEIFTQKNAS